MTRKAVFIGLGNMGFPMASNLLETFGSLGVYNRSQKNGLALVEKGATMFLDVKSVAQYADLVFLCLPGPLEVAEIVDGPEGLLSNGSEGQIILDFSTVSPALSKELSRKATQKKITYIDLPVSGGGLGAQKRELSLMIGATKAEVEELNLLPYLLCVGKTFHYMGERGKGSAIKIINNYMAFATQILNGEAIAMADRLDIPLESFYDVVTTSSGNNLILSAKKQKVLSGDLSASFTVDLSMKDLELARQLCQDGKMTNFSLNQAIQFYRLAQQLGYGQKDTASVIHVIRDLGKRTSLPD
ncbi:MAG TPA: hypothetical protein DCQ90_10700 [Erysipelotrichaceae bacterium]|nr:hypothetical protein [Erysipelotrichaceae bacterium]